MCVIFTRMYTRLSLAIAMILLLCSCESTALRDSDKRSEIVNPTCDPEYKLEPDEINNCIPLNSYKGWSSPTPVTSEASIIKSSFLSGDKIIRVYQYAQFLIGYFDKYYLYRPSTNGLWDVYEGTLNKTTNEEFPHLGFNAASEHIINSGIPRTKLPIKIQDAINMHAKSELWVKSLDEKLSVNTRDVIADLQLPVSKVATKYWISKREGLVNANRLDKEKYNREAPQRELEAQKIELRNQQSGQEWKAKQAQDTADLFSIYTTTIAVGSVIKKNQIAGQKLKTDKRNAQLAAQQAQFKKQEANFQTELAQANAQKARDYQQQRTNSNSESQQTVRQTASKRVELATEMQCVKASPTRREGSLQWYNWENHCSYPLNIKWCNTEACTASEWAHYDLQPGGTYESFTSIRNGRYIIRLVNACLTTSNGQEVKFDSNHCWIFN